MALTCSILFYFQPITKAFLFSMLFQVFFISFEDKERETEREKEKENPCMTERKKLHIFSILYGFHFHIYDITAATFFLRGVVNEISNH